MTTLPDKAIEEKTQGFDSIECSNGHLTGFFLLDGRVVWTGSWNNGISKYWIDCSPWPNRCLWCGQDLSEAVDKIENVAKLINTPTEKVGNEGGQNG